MQRPPLGTRAALALVAALAVILLLAGALAPLLLFLFALGAQGPLALILLALAKLLAALLRRRLDPPVGTVILAPVAALALPRAIALLLFDPFAQGAAAIFALLLLPVAAALLRLLAPELLPLIIAAATLAALASVLTVIAAAMILPAAATAALVLAAAATMVLLVAGPLAAPLVIVLIALRLRELELRRSKGARLRPRRTGHGNPHRRSDQQKLSCAYPKHFLAPFWKFQAARPHRGRSRRVIHADHRAFFVTVR
ncbi:MULTISPECIES: hypothetical protein [Rhodomicrobium]|uniref:hypothetical protein n=1 Tax=Rhodomicrobium TaxID=1068 RepID=UPI000F73B01A|nr:MULTISPECIES: hypothetical protein [Rhodomicrobium]